MRDLLRLLFFVLLIKPLAVFVLGLNVRNRERLPAKGAAILVSNHNSHLDTVVLTSLFPARLLPWLRPVAAEDYFLKNRFWRWYSQTLIGIVPIARAVPGGQPVDPFRDVAAALERECILLYYPEGTRGEPEQMTRFRSGIGRLAARFPDVPIYPIFLHGTGKSLPKNEGILVPFVCDVFVGEPLRWRDWSGSEAEFAARLEQEIRRLPGDAYLSRLS